MIAKKVAQKLLEEYPDNKDDEDIDNYHPVCRSYDGRHHPICYGEAPDGTEFYRCQFCGLDFGEM